MNPKGQWEFTTLKIDWEVISADDLVVFRYNGKSDMRGIANGFKYFMSRFPSRFWLHDMRELPPPAVHKNDTSYLAEKHITPFDTKEYRKFRAKGRDACVLGEDDKPRISHGISKVLELLNKLSPEVKSFESEEIALKWLIGRNELNRFRSQSNVCQISSNTTKLKIIK
jgi:hypothetical protein